MDHVESLAEGKPEPQVRVKTILTLAIRCLSGRCDVHGQEELTQIDIGYRSHLICTATQWRQFRGRIPKHSNFTISVTRRSAHTCELWEATESGPSSTCFPRLSMPQGVH